MDGFLDDVFDMEIDQRQAERKIFEMNNRRQQATIDAIGKIKLSSKLI